MFRGIRFVPAETHFDFVRLRFFGFVTSGLLLVVTVLALWWQGLNLGVDFRGGILLEVGAAAPIDVAGLRTQLNGLALGSVELQQFGGADTALIRIPMQPGDDAAQQAAVATVRASLGDAYEYRRVEVVGPRVGNELLQAGIWATVLAILGIALYVGVRFEWQFGLAAIIATLHDVLVTIGLFVVLQLDFDLAAVAAILTLAGYSINDTVVVFDRIRENLRRHRQPDLRQIINDAVNQTLSRTILTAGTTLLALLPLVLFGGQNLLNFALALTWGVVVGTFSSIYVAAALLLYMPPIRRVALAKAEAAGQ